MLTIVVSGTELFDESSQEFTTENDVILRLEHSLVSLSKWESNFRKPFLTESEKTTAEVVGYVVAMVLDPEIPEEVFSRLSETNFRDINEYIDSPMSATWFNEVVSTPRSKEIITSELIYYWMIVYNIPFECEKWHLNRLFTLIQICNLKQAKPKKMSRAELASRNRELNEKRKAQLGTRG